MQSYAYSRGSIPAQGSTSPSIAKPMLAIFLAGALTTCGTFYFLQRANSKVEPARPIAAQPAKTAHPGGKISGKSTQKKGHAAQQSKHTKSNDRHHSRHNRSSTVS